MTNMTSAARFRRLVVLTASVAILGLAGASITPATEAPSAERRARTQEHAREQIEELRERLDLTEEQEEQIRPILADAGKQIRKLHSSARDQERSRENMMAMREQAKRIHQETRAKLEPILSSEQLAEYDAIQEEWREEHRAALRDEG